MEEQCSNLFGICWTICAKTFQYHKTPYLKVIFLTITKKTSVLWYKISYLEKIFQNATIIRKTRKSGDAACYDPVMLVKLAKKGALSAEKKADLKIMLKFIYLFIYASASSRYRVFEISRGDCSNR